MPTWVRFERGRDGVIGPTYGPYPFVQLTYTILRAGPNGGDIAVMQADGDWILSDAEREDRVFSDAIIYDSSAGC